MQDTLEVLVVPAVLGIIMIGVWAHWLTIFLFVFSTGDIEGGQRKAPFNTVDWENDWRNLLWYWFIGGLWTYNGLLCIN